MEPDGENSLHSFLVREVGYALRGLGVFICLCTNFIRKQMHTLYVGINS